MKVGFMTSPLAAPRRIARRTRGHVHGPITRLMSPSDLGQIIKPFVFLDLFDVTGKSVSALEKMPIHPHSGLATVTVLTEGGLHYNASESGSGTIDYGGVEWLRAGSGVWHGKEMSAENVPRIQGFQLWLSLPPELENSEPVSLYVESTHMAKAGPAHVIVGNYDGVQSPVPAPDGINYLLVTLRAGERWTYKPPVGQIVGWLALAQGKLNAGSDIDAGEMVIFENADATITLQALGTNPAVFVLGSAVPHPHPLYLGSYSVHTSAQALESGERRIADLRRKMLEAGDRGTGSGIIPVFR